MRQWCRYCIIVEISKSRYYKVTDIDVILKLLMFTEQDAGGAGWAVWCWWPGGAGHDRTEEEEVQQQQPLWAQCSAWHDTVSIQSLYSLFKPVKCDFPNNKEKPHFSYLAYSSVSFHACHPSSLCITQAPCNIGIFSRFDGGAPTILTLKDSNVLDQTEDTLVNVNMIDDERAEKVSWGSVPMCRK